jgi:hypothetical protein
MLYIYVMLFSSKEGSEELYGFSCIFIFMEIPNSTYKN